MSSIPVARKYLGRQHGASRVITRACLRVATFAMAETLFLKVERVRRLRAATLLPDISVRRGEDGSFGIGLSDDNEVTTFHHSHRAHVTSVASCSATAGAPSRPLTEPSHVACTQDQLGAAANRRPGAAGRRPAARA